MSTVHNRCLLFSYFRNHRRRIRWLRRSSRKTPCLPPVFLPSALLSFNLSSEGAAPRIPYGRTLWPPTLLPPPVATHRFTSINSNKDRRSPPRLDRLRTGGYLDRYITGIILQVASRDKQTWAPKLVLSQLGTVLGTSVYYIMLSTYTYED
ncbi:hypothetical protein GGR53DRAFT_3114 [Hypoxylon sp. FL1150]|nr:hypothetical protein GGR53DRAFT_3114 [Hypoxylon sp. FL1150]